MRRTWWLWLAAFGCAASTGTPVDPGRGADAAVVVPRDGGARDLGADVDLAVADLSRPPPPCIVAPIGELCPPVIYVSTGGNDANTGLSPTDPLHTLTVGVARAVRCGGLSPPCTMVVAGGLYREQVQLADGIVLLGGYTQDFSARDPANNVVTITSDDPRTVIVDSIGQPTTVDGVTINGAALAGSDGSSSYALWVHASRQVFTLSHATLHAGQGAAGTPGTPGLNLACGTVGASGGTAFDCGGSTGAYGTAAGNPVSGGGAGTGGNSNCPDACPLTGTDGISDGNPGTAGNAGGNGAAGSPTSDGLGSVTAGMWSGSASGAGTRGFNGTGGGGGGSGGTKRIRVCFGCGTLTGGRGGDGAPGGCGGGGGAAGGPGGGAFALMLDSSEITLDTVVVVGGSGGQGGRGGDGRDGQSGGTVVNNGKQGSSESECGVIDYYSGGGAIGGVGGKGGAGAGGAGGVGGAAITVARAGSSVLDQVGSVQISAGTPGAGGSGGQGPGNAGASGPSGAVAVDHAY